MRTIDEPVRDPLLRVDDLVVEYATGNGIVHAVSGATFDVSRGETLGIVGESGSGKSTLLRAMLRLTPHSGGSVRHGETVLTDLDEKRMRPLRPSLQIIMQDPIASLNPRRRVRDIVAEGLHMWPDRVVTSVEKQVAEGLEAVGMDIGTVGDRRPGSFSGGQCQRIAIARALALRPDVLFCDEPVSALDVSVQARVLNLIQDAKEALGLTVLFVSHDLGVVKSVSDRVMVMYLGRVCEIAPVEDIYDAPAHPYTNLLLSSAPGSRRPAAPDLTGETPSPLDPPSGCRFRTRCPLARDRCAEETPPLRALPAGRSVACHFPLAHETEAGATA